MLWGEPQFVFADLFIIRDHSLVDDYMEVLLFYPGMRVRVKSSYLGAVRLCLAYSVYGHNGTFFKSRADVQEKNLLAGKMPEGADWGIEPEGERGLLHTEIDGKVVRELVPTERGDAREYFRGLPRRFGMVRLCR
ncbi:hypothetical protein ACQ86N_31795 [Puia sp. P3]|uniref:hypothetical protein n=1 Tax=Puia sp. P3 TaxID=3423952 RepID=UPI003D669120